MMRHIDIQADKYYFTHSHHPLQNAHAVALSAIGSRQVDFDYFMRGGVLRRPRPAADRQELRAKYYLRISDH